MIVGSGMLSKAFGAYEDNKEVAIFASGVSNSRELRASEFDREKGLLRQALKNYKDSLFVYFGTCAVYDTYPSLTSYVRHKLEVEKIISCSGNDYLIVRLPQLIGLSENRKTLVNFLFDAIRDGIKFRLYNVERNLIDVGDVFRIVSEVVDNGLAVNSILNVANTSNVMVAEIVGIIEGLLNKGAVFDIEEMGGRLRIDTAEMERLVDVGGIFTDNYIPRALRRYIEPPFIGAS